jgi:hypothetical protein
MARSAPARRGRFSTTATASPQETGFKRKGDAVNVLKRREGSIAKGEPVTRAIVTLTVDAALADVVKDYKINDKRTLAHVGRRIRKHLMPYFGGRRLAYRIC